LIGVVRDIWKAVGPKGPILLVICTNLEKHILHEILTMKEQSTEDLDYPKDIVLFEICDGLVAEYSSSYSVSFSLNYGMLKQIERELDKMLEEGKEYKGNYFVLGPDNINRYFKICFKPFFWTSGEVEKIEVEFEGRRRFDFNIETLGEYKGSIKEVLFDATGYQFKEVLTKALAARDEGKKEAGPYVVEFDLYYHVHESYTIWFFFRERDMIIHIDHFTKHVDYHNETKWIRIPNEDLIIDKNKSLKTEELYINPLINVAI